ncbi:conserved Plasmodium protein, unknown function [Plasmodium vinckei vinckei]|uniref:Uncharacterized protein n=1 Tax=Plasmodium vinckei vinckei TaxID=54757 RepID=A0A081IAQ4_PLAVN|nr:conserved Plasmodium protein, unknown function [Plasmodium vinckei vinckei]KEG00762.1 hypothetical protein YYE_04208 [Plasmodium vinckei vinckei]VEV55825.1 conserved Plasmodium protein, unknown function [Plasmodium vinckei vinckei]
MPIDTYKKSKKLSLGTHYNKDNFSRRRGNTYGYNRYRNYNYYKLPNYQKTSNYEMAPEMNDRDRDANESKKVSNVIDTNLQSNTSNNTNSMRKAKIGKNEENIEEANKKINVVKILKRPAENVQDGIEPKSLKLLGKTNLNIKPNEVEENNDNNNSEVADEKKKEKKCKKNIANSKSLSKIKDNKDIFNFTSTQELFNLLLQNVKETDDDTQSNNAQQIASINTEIMDKEKELAMKKSKKNKLHNTKIATTNIVETKNNKDSIDAKKKNDLGGLTQINNNAILEGQADGTGVIEKRVTFQLIDDLPLKEEKGMDIGMVDNINKINGMMGNVYSKTTSAKYPSYAMNSHLLNNIPKEELCKTLSLKHESFKKGKKEDDESLFVIPLYMRSPKPEQIPIPSLFSADGSSIATDMYNGSDGFPSNCVSSLDNINGYLIGSNSIEFPMNNQQNPEAYYSTPSLIGFNNSIFSKTSTEKNNSKVINVTKNGSNSNIKSEVSNSNKLQTKKYGKSLKSSIANEKTSTLMGVANNVNSLNASKKNKTYLNKKYNITSSLDQNKLRLKYDTLNIGNVKPRKLHNNEHYAYIKTSNYMNGTHAYNKTSRNFKVDKHFNNRKYNFKTATYFNDTAAQRNKNLNSFKNVKIEAY